MHEVKQTRTGLDGNCFQACVASILELPLEAVPDFCNIYSEDDWWDRFQDWLEEFDLGAIDIYLPETEKQRLSIMPYTAEMILSGPSPRHPKHMHSVIGRYSEAENDIVTVWDPHPDNTGLTTTDAILFIISLYPAQQFQQKLHTCSTCNKSFVETADTEVGSSGCFCSACLTEDAKKAKGSDRKQRRKSCTKER